MGAAAAVAALFSLGVMQSSVVTQVAGWFNQNEETNLLNSAEVEIESEIEETLSIPAPRVVKNTVATINKTTHSKGYSIVVGSFKEKNRLHWKTCSSKSTYE